MGFIKEHSGKVALEAHLTQRGRELIAKNGISVIEYFSMGDSDVNYDIFEIGDAGSIPDVVGNNEIGISDGIGVKTYLVTDIDGDLSNVISTDRVKIITQDNQKSSNLTVNINIHNYIGALINRYEGMIFGDNPFSVSSSPLQNLYRNIVVDRVNNHTGELEQTFKHEVEFEFVTKGDYKIFNELNGNSNDIISSPLAFKFSSLGNIEGAGKCSVLIGNRSYGYTDGKTFKEIGDVEIGKKYTYACNETIVPAVKFKDNIYDTLSFDKKYPSFFDNSDPDMNHMFRYARENGKFLIIDEIRTLVTYMRTLPIVNGKFTTGFNLLIKSFERDDVTAANLTINVIYDPLEIKDSFGDTILNSIYGHTYFSDNAKASGKFKDYTNEKIIEGLI